MDSVERDDRDDIVWSDAQAIIRGLEERVALLTGENARLRDMLASAIQSLDTVTAVRDITEQARLELLTSLQRMGHEVEVLRAEVMRLEAR
jgi:uncharacterized small protein (DUF1192 family)